MEAVEDRFPRLGRNAWTFVVDANPDFVADAGRGDLDQAAGRREADRIVDDRVDRPGEAVGLAHHHRRIHARPGEGDARVPGLAPGLPAVHQLFDQLT